MYGLVLTAVPVSCVAAYWFGVRAGVQRERQRQQLVSRMLIEAADEARRQVRPR